MSVKVIDYHPILKLKSKINGQTAVRLALQDVERYARKITPYSGGGKGSHLRDSTFISVFGTKGQIVWNKHYAESQERGFSKSGKKFVNYTTPGTGPHYAEKSIEEVSKHIDKYFRGLL
jgi:hypothetical protein